MYACLLLLAVTPHEELKPHPPALVGRWTASWGHKLPAFDLELFADGSYQDSHHYKGTWKVVRKEFACPPEQGPKVVACLQIRAQGSDEWNPDFRIVEITEKQVTCVKRDWTKFVLHRPQEKKE